MTGMYVINKWDYRFLELAAHVGSWSKDPSTKVGAVIVRGDRTIASVGFNGFPRGVDDAPERYADRPTKYMMTVHAELNAILSAKEPMTQKHVLYVSPLHPCANCAAAIIQSGIKTVVFPIVMHRPDWEDHFKIARQMFLEAGITTVIVEPTGRSK